MRWHPMQLQWKLQRWWHCGSGRVGVGCCCGSHCGGYGRHSGSETAAAVDPKVVDEAVANITVVAALRWWTRPPWPLLWHMLRWQWRMWRQWTSGGRPGTADAAVVAVTVAVSDVAAVDNKSISATGATGASMILFRLLSNSGESGLSVQKNTFT